MRIIAGSKRRMALKTLPGKDIRPTTDRIKETLFNIIQDEVPGCCFLDLFAGSGQIGLEAVSRGARCAVFVERSPKAVSCIEENIRHTRSQEECRILKMDVIPALRYLEGKYRFGVVFMDPPYQEGLEREVMNYFKTSSLLEDGALFIIEAALDTDFSYLGELGFTIVKEKKYKTNRHVFVTLQTSEEEAL